MSFDDALPSWNDGPAKQSIFDFIQRVTAAGSRHFVAPHLRIATFDNDGTLWTEQPAYVQAVFALDRIKALAPRHPEWKAKQPFQAALAGDLKSVVEGGEHAIVELLMASHAGMTTDQFEKIVTDWIETARHPRFARLYTELVYQPMLELVEVLRAADFQVFIASGGGVEFMRPWVERIYGVPPQNVIGSRIQTRLEARDGRPVLMRLPQVDFVDDKEGKPSGIHHHIGRRPIAAFGNSDGDRQMLEWTTAGDGSRFGMLVHHTDELREWAYDRESQVGRLDDALDEAPARGWTVADMKRDWKRIYRFER